MFAYSFGFDADMTNTAYPSYIKETLPASHLGYGTNNRYPSAFPPKMHDGRSVISSWVPESVIDQEYWKEHDFQQRNPFNPNWMYRRYLQKNAYEVMAKNFVESANDTGAQIPRENQMPMDVAEQTKKAANVPFIYAALNDPSTPQGYESSDLKSLYLSREQLQARKSAPTIGTYV
jgi:hypothetical protein